MRRNTSRVLLPLVRRLPLASLAAVAFVLLLGDLLVPDLIPFADELLLGSLTLLFGAFSRTRSRPPAATPVGA
jgi:hypothetical protein